MEQWQRRRHPEDVPTPIAVAVADFCRRAKAAAPAGVVREALAVLGDDDDFRVKEITDGEPEAKPLGPFALVDLIHGTSAATAAQRQETGYYDLVRALAAKTEAPAKPSPPPAPPKTQPVILSPVKGDDEKAERKRKKAALTVTQRIAPKKRTAPVERPAPPPPKEVIGPRKKNLPLPRGKFTRIEAEASRLSELEKSAGKAELLGLIEQTGNRVALRHRLETQYVVRRGTPPAQEDVDALLARHGLMAAVQKREREAILGGLSDAKGSLTHVAFAQGLTPYELDRLIASTGLKPEVERIRERWVREALSTPNLKMRLDLLGRGKYLADLKIVRRFKDALERDLLDVLEALPVMPDLDLLIAAAAKKHALPAEALRTAIDRLGIETQLDFEPDTGAP